MSQIRVALVGDFSRDVVAHRAINECFAIARQSKPELEPHWLATESIVPEDQRQLKGFNGIWCVPASPYRSTEGALWAIQYARINLVPFLGTCGGYQHALLEFARNVLGHKTAGHTELDPNTSLPFLDRMQCSLVEQSQTVLITEDHFRSMYGADSGEEGFRCRYGLNPKYESILEGSTMRIVARAEDGQCRAFRLEGHPFFIGTQFQPERRALSGHIHPLVQAFFSAASNTLTK